MTVTENATADQGLSATDANGDALTFTKAAGPLFMTVTTASAGTGTGTGNVHLAPSAGTAGTYAATVRVDDGRGGTDQKSFTITVNQAVNRPPTSNPGGPYSGTVGVPVRFDGSRSTDPDGNALTYDWNFGDGMTGTGVTVDHSYSTQGTFTVSLKVTDNGTPPLDNTATTTATITNTLPARVFPAFSGVIKPRSGKPRYCFQIEPVGGDYANSDVILASIVAKYNGRTIPVDPSRTVVNADLDGNGIQEIQACFTKANMIILFAGLPSGDNAVTMTIEGDLVTGARFSGNVNLIVKGPVAGSAFASASVSPNPLNPDASLSFATSMPGTVKVDLFDVQGRLVRTILSPTFMAAGSHELKIDGRGQSGEKLASGIYFVRGVTADGVFKNTITILK